MSEKNTRYVAKTMMGMEPLVAEELKELGASNIQEKRRAVFFEGDLELLYRANLELRCAVSILKPLFWFRAHKESVLYKQVGMFRPSDVFTHPLQKKRRYVCQDAPESRRRANNG